MTTNRSSLLSSVIGGIVIAGLFCAMGFGAIPRFEAIYADLFGGGSLPTLTLMVVKFGRGGSVLAGALLGIGFAAGGLERDLRWLRWVCGGLAVLLLIIVAVGLVVPLSGTVVDSVGPG